MVAMATNSNITVPQKYTAKYKNVGYGWDTSHPTTISKKFIILIYHYLHAVILASTQPENLSRRSMIYLYPPFPLGICTVSAANSLTIVRMYVGSMGILFL